MNPAATHPAEPGYRLVRPDAELVAAPALDAAQQSVVDHPGGPLLVLAGPGTGKTTTLVEAIVDRIENRGASPDAVLALTFSRKAAEQLRDRVTARLGRTTSTRAVLDLPLLRLRPDPAVLPAELYAGPLRLLSAPEQDVVLRELLTDAPESVRWPDTLRARARHPRLRPRGAGRARAGAGEGAGRRGAAQLSARSTTCRSTSPPGCSSSSTSPTSTSRAPPTTPTSSGAR